MVWEWRVQVLAPWSFLRPRVKQLWVGMDWTTLWIGSMCWILVIYSYWILQFCACHKSKLHSCRITHVDHEEHKTKKLN